jgi:conjugal transfer pilus assembly protein TraD
VVETFGKTGIHTMRVGRNLGADTHLGDWSSGQSVQITDAMEERIPADMLGKLPNLQYFAQVSGGRLIKGRFPILNPDFDRAAARDTGAQP